MPVVQPPWYRQFWPWFVLAPLAAVVVASFVTLFVAGAPPPLVVDNFATIEMASEQERQRDLRATALGLEAEIRFDSAGEVSVRLSGDAPGAITLRLVHPTQAERDRAVLLARSAGAWSGTLAAPATRMYVELADVAGTWRLTGEIRPGTTTLVLSAAPGTRP